MEAPLYDVAVVGVGSMGAFVCLELARRGLSVIGIDQFHPPHAQGSHSGETRVYREAYAEHPDYVPLAVLAGRLWEQYGAECGQKLLTRCGQISVGHPESRLLAGLQRSARLHDIGIECFETQAMRECYPMIATAEDEVGILEHGAGWVHVDAALTFALEAVREAGGTLRLGTMVDGWEHGGEGVTLLVGGERIRARRLIVTAGAWAPTLLVGQRLPLQVQRKTLLWMRPREVFLTPAATMPVTTFAERFFYSFPAKDGLVKIAVHWSAGDSTAEPGALAEPGGGDLEEGIAEAVTHLGPMFGDLRECRQRMAASRSCLYTMTPDEHFILDRVPGAPVWYAAGFSGHGFKFAPAIGRVLAEMVLEQTTSVPVAFLSASRFDAV